MQPQNHPHMHGEYITPDPLSFVPSESSPYVRGIFIIDSLREFMVGNIPVCTGNTSTLWFLPSLCVKHPRIHGEYSHRVCNCMMALETSPYARGIHHFRCRVQTELRNIPTCVGNTSQDSMGHRKGRNHPHVHGEYPGAYPSLRMSTEPSPCAWGIPCKSGEEFLGFGTIPMCMGNTLKNLVYGTLPWNHPHVHGEYSERAWMRGR